MKCVTNCETIRLYSREAKSSFSNLDLRMDLKTDLRSFRSEKHREMVLNEKIRNLNPCEFVTNPEFLIDDIELEDLCYSASKLKLEKDELEEINNSILAEDNVLIEEQNVCMVDINPEILEPKIESKISEPPIKKFKVEKNIDLTNSYINNPFSRWAFKGCKYETTHFG